MRTSVSRPRAFSLAGAALAALMGAVLAAATNTDSGIPRARELIAAATAEMRNDPEASRRDAAAAVEQLRLDPQADLEVQARLLLCDYYSERDRAAAESQIAAARALLPRVRRAGLGAGILTCNGETLEAAGDNAQAGRLFDQAVDAATRTGDDDMLAEALFSRGYLLGVEGQYAAGLSDLRRSERLFDRLGKPIHSLTVLTSIATLYNQMGDYAEAARIFERTLAAQHNGNMHRDEAVTLYNLGRTHEMLGDWSAAHDAYASAMALFEQIDYPRGTAYALRGLAAVADAGSDPNQALELLTRADTLAGRAADARLVGLIDLERGIALHRLARLRDSAGALQKARAVFGQADSQSELATTLTHLAAVEAALGDWHQAYAARTQAQSVSDALLRKQLDQRFATLKVEFDTATRDRENALLRRENAANQAALLQGRRASHLQWAVIALSALLLALLTTLMIFQWRNSRRMQALAMTDELTGLPNRRALLERLAGLLERRGSVACALLIIDLDHFKGINDSHGHPVGDETLRRVSASLRAAVTEPDFLGRLGGEEFAAVLIGSDAGAAIDAADRLREQITALDFAHCFTDRRVTVSIGVTRSQPGDDISAMLRRADRALYAAKHAGRNCVRAEIPVTGTATWPSLQTG